MRVRCCAQRTLREIDSGAHGDARDPGLDRRPRRLHRPGDGTAGVAAGGPNDGDPPARARQRRLEHLANKLHGEVFEGQGRPVEEFQQEMVGRQLLQGRPCRVPEIRICRVNEAAELSVGESFADEGAHDAKGDVLVADVCIRHVIGKWIGAAGSRIMVIIRVEQVVAIAAVDPVPSGAAHQPIVAQVAEQPVVAVGVDGIALGIHPHQRPIAGVEVEQELPGVRIDLARLQELGESAWHIGSVVEGAGPVEFR